MQDFMCVPNASQDVKASETLKLSTTTSQTGLFFLASRPGCQNCHARLENATDKHYEVAYQYGTLGRGVFVGLRTTF